jgi:prolipoprotein diacylglyceryl transferase
MPPLLAHSPPGSSLLASIPSPSSNALHLGKLQLHYYGLCIALGVLAAVWLGRRRWAALGHRGDELVDLAFWAVPGGLIGARVYSVITDFNRLYADHPGDIIKIWKGGLGIPGGVIGGVAVGVWYARRHDMHLPSLFDVVAPCLPLAQAVGRFGNWFNQELYGRHTSLPWGLEIDVAHRSPSSVLPYSTFHPTFLYEALWNLTLVGLIVTFDRWRGREPGWVLGALYGFLALGVGADVWLVVQRQQPQAAGTQVVLLVVGALVGGALLWRLLRFDRRGPRRIGDLFALYLAGYFLGRLWVESLRIDTANTILGLRVNEWTSLVVIAAALGFLAARRRSPAVAPAADATRDGPGGDGDEDEKRDDATPADRGSEGQGSRQVASGGDPAPHS